MAEPAPKKRKLTKEWFLEQLRDVETQQAEQKTAAADILARFPEDDIRRASSQEVATFLQMHVTDETDRNIVASTDALCKWLDEAVQKTPKPSEWETDSAQNFENTILGVGDMKKTMIVRECYAQMKAQITGWLHEKHAQEDPTGMFVITGTPGIGKSVFLAYMAALLAEKGYGIVIQRAAMFWSLESKKKAAAHGEEKPIMLLQNRKVVLLADPGGGGTSQSVHSRDLGCTLVFVSLHEAHYKDGLKQQSNHSERRFMPVWSEAEVGRHHKVLFPGEEEATAKEAYWLLGGSVRWLRDLFEVQRRKGLSLEEVARHLLERYLSVKSWDDLDLLMQHFKQPQSVEDKKESKMSYLLVVHASAISFDEPEVRLIDSKVAQEVLCEKLHIKTTDEQRRFVQRFLHEKHLGSLVGNIFQELVLNHLTGKGATSTTLDCSSLPAGKTWKIRVPNQKCELQPQGAKASQSDLKHGYIYHPLSDNFPAADFFFINAPDATLWLLQTTKNDKHACRIGAMQERFKAAFRQESLIAISAIKWVIIAPSEIAAKYTVEQEIFGQWQLKDKPVVDVEQYIAEWKMG